jgi:putative spermidine/putrescine transport system permease protein
VQASIKKPRPSPLFWTQLAFTLTVCAFLIVPVLMSMTAGVTLNYMTGVSGGLTAQWVEKVLTDYRGPILLSLQLAISCLAITLLLGIPAAYVLAKRQNVFTRCGQR